MYQLELSMYTVYLIPQLSFMTRIISALKFVLTCCVDGMEYKKIVIFNRNIDLVQTNYYFIFVFFSSVLVCNVIIFCFASSAVQPTNQNVPI